MTTLRARLTTLRWSAGVTPAAILLVAAGLLLAGSTPSAQAPARFEAATCFPFETLSPALRTRAETLLLRALDGEALYSIAADIKPMSSGVASTRVKVDAPDLTEVEQLRQILRTWTCGGELSAHLHHFAAVYDGARPVEVMVVNHRALRRALDDSTAFFGPYALSSSSDPMEVMMAVEYDRTSARFRGYGLLFGFPLHAVDFFVEAARSQAETGTFVERDFISLPTGLGANHFVYAVPKGHVAVDADRALRARVEPIFADYQARRARHIRGESAAGVLDLVREWFDDGRGNVRPSNAWDRTSAHRGEPTPVP
jgi:hypothetical protein